MKELEAGYEKRGEGNLFKTLQPCLAKGRDRLSYDELGKSLDLSEGAVKVTVHRMRKRYRELLREKVAQTVSSAEEAEEELRHLFQALAGS
jgi:hypothetical protein